MTKTKDAPSPPIEDTLSQDIEIPEAGSFGYVDISKLVKADWNYKEEDPEKSEKLKANIKRIGQIENVIIRELETGFLEVVNGNHRYDVLKDLNHKKVFVYNCGSISLPAAQRIAVETNETRFATDNLKLAGLIKEIRMEYPSIELEKTMPYTMADIDGFEKLLDFNWNQYSGGTGSKEDPDDSLTRTFTITVAVEDEVILEEIREICKRYPSAKIT